MKAPKRKKKNPRPRKGRKVHHVCNSNDSKKSQSDPSWLEKLCTVACIGPEFVNNYWELIENVLSLF